MKPVFGSGYRLNPDHPLNQGLTDWLSINERSGYVVYGIRRSITGTLASVTNAWGQYGVYFGGSGDGCQGVLLSGYSNPSQITIIIKLRTYIVEAAYGFYISNDAATGDSGISIGQSPDKKVYVAIGNGYVAANAALANNTSYVLALSTTYAVGATPQLYINGTLQSGATATATVLNTSGNMYLGRRANAASPSYCTQVSISSCTIYSRKLSRNEIFTDYVNPYGTPSNPRLLFPSGRRYFYPEAGPAPSFKPYWIPKPSQIIGGGLN